VLWFFLKFSPEIVMFVISRTTLRHLPCVLLLFFIHLHTCYICLLLTAGTKYPTRSNLRDYPISFILNTTQTRTELGQPGLHRNIWHVKCTSVCVCVCVCVCVYSYISLHIVLNTYIYTYIYIWPLLSLIVVICC
jgi:hypothetical protein